MLPYGKQSIDEKDVEAVLAALQSDWLTTGPRVDSFESAFANTVNASSAVAVSSGTAALHAAMFACDIGPEDEVIVPAITFVATANAVLYQGGTPVFADVSPETLLIDPQDVRRKLTAKTKAIVAMDYAGQPCDYESLNRLAREFNLPLIADSCHSLGGSFHNKPVGTLADLNCFSLHPVKPITSGEGGIVTTSNERLAEKMRIFRNHGITTDHRQRESANTHAYGMTTLGFNYRLTDIQCALAESQLLKLEQFTQKRNELAEYYIELLQDVPWAVPLKHNSNLTHAYHLFVIRWQEHASGLTRDEAFRELRSREIGVNVHYLPVYRHPYYRELMPTELCCPWADEVYDEILSLPIFPEMKHEDVEHVVTQIKNVAQVTATT